jgi:hypothetical protein
MSDTETRLRDYLQAKADTVADTSAGPGLETTGTTSGRRGWMPIALAAAAIGAILVLAVPYLMARTDAGRPDPAGTTQPTPAAPTKGPVPTYAPRVPYTLAVNTKPVTSLDPVWVSLFDNGKTIKNPGNIGEVVGRVADGWLVLKGTIGSRRSLGVLDTSGKFRTLGPSNAASPYLSPDHRQVVVGQSTGEPGTPSPDDDSHIVVLDVATGKEVARISGPGVGPAGWTKDGVLLMGGTQANPTVLSWQPGSQQTTQVHGLQHAETMQAIPATGQLLENDWKGCVRLGIVRGDQFVEQHKYCGAADFEPAASPDGRTLFDPRTKVAVDTVTWKTTKIGLPDILRGMSWPVFEDASHVLVVTQDLDPTPAIDRMYRCSVATGECKLLQTGKSGEVLRLRKP